MDSKTISYKKGNLFYRILGQGKSILLIHGFGEDGNIWNGLAESLKNNYQLIIPDLPGTGKSDLLQGNVSIGDYAETIKFILDKETIDNCIMIGHSMGGYITLAFAEKYPEQLKALGLFHSSAFADDKDKIQTRSKSIEFIKQNGAHAFLKTSTPGLFSDDFQKRYPEIVENLIVAEKNFNTDALIQYQQAMINRPDGSQILKNFSMPVLLISGEKDKAVSLNISLKQASLPSICHFHLLPSSAHVGMLEEKEVSQKFLLEFVNDVSF